MGINSFLCRLRVKSWQSTGRIAWIAGRRPGCYKTALPSIKIIEVVREIRCYTLAGSLILAHPALFPKNPVDARTALAMIRDSSGVLHVLLAKGHTTYAGRLAGAFRNIGRDQIAQEIIDATGYPVFLNVDCTTVKSQKCDKSF